MTESFSAEQLEWPFPDDDPFSQSTTNERFFSTLPEQVVQIGEQSQDFFEETVVQQSYVYPGTQPIVNFESSYVQKVPVVQDVPSIKQEKKKTSPPKKRNQQNKSRNSGLPNIQFGLNESEWEIFNSIETVKKGLEPIKELQTLCGKLETYYFLLNQSFQVVQEKRKQFSSESGNLQKNIYLEQVNQQLNFQYGQLSQCFNEKQNEVEKLKKENSDLKHQLEMKNDELSRFSEEKLRIDSVLTQISNETTPCKKIKLEIDEESRNDDTCKKLEEIHKFIKFQKEKYQQTIVPSDEELLRIKCRLSELDKTYLKK